MTVTMSNETEADEGCEGGWETGLTGWRVGSSLSIGIGGSIDIDTSIDRCQRRPGRSSGRGPGHLLGDDNDNEQTLDRRDAGTKRGDEKK